jgi:hypothetical protein
VNRTIDVLDVQTHLRVLVQDADLLGRGKPFEVVEDGSIQELGLPQGAERHASISGAGGEDRDGVAVTGADGVMRSLNDVRVFAECLEDTAVELTAAEGREPIFDRLARQVVSKGDAVVVVHQQTRTDALVDRAQIDIGNRRDDVRCALTSEDRGGVQRVTGATRESSSSTQDRVAHRCRQLVVGGGNDLGDEERIALGPCVDGGGIERRTDREQRDSARAEWRQRETRDGWTDERAPCPPEGVVLREVVAVRRDDEAGKDIEPTSDEAQEVECRFVGPLKVLEHDDHRVRRRSEIGQ